MLSKLFVEKLISIAKEYKTLYILGCFGAPMTEKNKKRYTSNYSYNKTAERKAMIMSASEDTFGFDCVCLIKGVLWGWCGDATKVYGGASYKANDVPDINANTMIAKCTDVSSDFTTIVPGEIVWMSGHCGVYIGNGLAVECTPKWDNCVQITAVGNIGSKAGYNTRTWKKHGFCPWVDYSDYFTPAEPDTGDGEEGETDDGESGSEDTRTVAGSFKELQLGSEGASVQSARVLLASLGYVSASAGYPFGLSTKFDADMETMVRVFQSDKGLTIDGVIGEQTWSCLLGF